MTTRQASLVIRQELGLTATCSPRFNHVDGAFINSHTDFRLQEDI